MKKLTALVVVVAMIITAVTTNPTYSMATVTALAVNTKDEYATEGTCGDNAEWFINSDATLVICGSGTLQKEDQFGNWPWEAYAKDIQRVIVENGITALGTGIFHSSAFSNCENITEAVFASTVTDLKRCLSGSNMSDLEDIWIYADDVEQTFSANKSSYPSAGSGTKWHVHRDTTTEQSLRDGLGLTDNDIEYITEGQKFPAVGNRTPVSIPKVTETSGPSGLLSEWKWDDSTCTLTFSGKGTISIPNEYYGKYKEAAEHIVIDPGIIKIDAITSAAMDSNPCGAFYSFTKLKDADLPDTIREIGDGTFRQCSSLTRLISGLPEGLEEIGVAAFMESSLSEDIVLPQTVDRIGRYGFSDTDIASVKLHEGMTLGGCCFRNCNSLQEVTIPKEIYFQQTPTSNAPRPSSTFAGCGLLERVIIEGAGTAASVGGDIENALPPFLFDNCPSLKEVWIETEELAYVGKNDDNSYTFDMTNDPIFWIYKGSITEAALTEAGYLTKENTKYCHVDTTALEEAVTRAEGIDASQYTRESADILDAALTNAKGILEQEYPLPSAVKEAITTLENAIATLVEKELPSPTPGGGGTQPSPTPGGDETKPSPTPGGDETQPSPTPGEDVTQPSPTPGGDVTQPTTPPGDTEKVSVKKVIIKKLSSPKKKTLKIKWKKVGGATGYQMQVAKKKNFKEKEFDKFTTKSMLVINKKLKSKKFYFVRVRAYVTYQDANGEIQKIYGKWSSKCKVRMK